LPFCTGTSAPPATSALFEALGSSRMENKKREPGGHARQPYGRQAKSAWLSL
jgi:hypothetical protein